MNAAAFLQIGECLNNPAEAVICQEGLSYLNARFQSALPTEPKMMGGLTCVYPLEEWQQSPWHGGLGGQPELRLKALGFYECVLAATQCYRLQLR